jgi:hypothetical protein
MKKNSAQNVLKPSSRSSSYRTNPQSNRIIELNRNMNTESATGEYLLLFRGSPWDRGLSSQELQQLMDKVMRWLEELKEQGKVRAGQALAAENSTVSARHGRIVADGPFAESKELVGGYLLLRADDFDEAIAIAKSNPTLPYGITIEVRPVLAECPVFQRAKARTGQVQQAAAEPVVA